MPTKNIKRATRVEYCDVMCTLSTFLAGIFFTSIILLIQFKEFSPVMIWIELGILRFHFSLPIELIIMPLTFSFICFMFNAIHYGRIVSLMTWHLQPQNEVDRLLDRGLNIFLVGLISVFISLFLILLLVNFWVAFAALAMLVLVFRYESWSPPFER